jgi:tetratricopeptide (TPR) repeat protein
VKGTLAACLAAVALACGQQASSEGAIRQLISDGRYTEAESLARGALADAEARSGAHSKSVAEVLDDLLDILYYSGRVRNPEDQALANRAVALNEELFGPASPELAATLRRAGEYARHNEDYEQARPLLRRAIEVFEALPAGASPLQEHAEAWTGMASLLKDTFDYQGARADYERALPLYEKALGHEHRLVAVCLNDLATTLARLGDYARARALFQEALRIYDKTVGPDHILTAGCLNNFAFLLTETGKPAEAAELLRKVVRIATATYGERHPRTASAFANLGDALSASGDYDAAAANYERSGETRVAVFGPLSREATSVLALRAVNLGLSGKTAPAVETGRTSRETCPRAFDLIAIRTMPEREALLRMGAKSVGPAAVRIETRCSALAAAGGTGPARARCAGSLARRGVRRNGVAAPRRRERRSGDGTAGDGVGGGARGTRPPGDARSPSR